MCHRPVARVLLAQAANARYTPASLSRGLACRRAFKTSSSRPTDGVYKELTEMRIRTPWIEALREAQNLSGATPPPPPKPDLTPKRMSDSYVSLVLPLAVSIPTYLSTQWTCFAFVFPCSPNK